MVAEGLAALINSQADMKVVGNVGLVAESVPAAEGFAPDVVLLDYRLPDGTAADAAAGIRAVLPGANVIFLTREDSDAARFAAVQPEPAPSSTSRRRLPRSWPRFATSPAARC